MMFVTQPERYDVVVTENMFGDIVSDSRPASSAASAWRPRAT
jgi:isocitrate/isopropylmalate dehydrogenase